VQSTKRTCSFVKDETSVGQMCFFAITYGRGAVILPNGPIEGNSVPGSSLVCFYIGHLVGIQQTIPCCSVRGPWQCQIN
jgi:hypothetical protein